MFKIGDAVQRIPSARFGVWRKETQRVKISTDAILIVGEITPNGAINFRDVQIGTRAGWYTKNFQLARVDYTIEEFL